MLRPNFLAGLAAAAATTLYRECVASTLRTRAGFTRVRLGYAGNVCEAVTITAPGGPAFFNESLSAELVPFGSQGALAGALNAGAVDAASMNLPSLIGALDRGCRVRVAAGLHTGCMSVLARDGFGLYRPLDLKGQTVGTDRLGSPPMNLLMAILARQGLDPRREVGWREYSPGGLDSALQGDAVNCVAVSDPIAYELQAAHRAGPFLDTAGGGFSCGADIVSGHHCFLVFADGLVERRPSLAAALTRAYLKGSIAFGSDVKSAQADAIHGHSRGHRRETMGMLSSYTWRASTDFVVEELELTARDFQKAGLLRTKTDPMAFAERAFAPMQDV
jgi:NitT/TauT family transport system substrate-binding protein